MTNLTGEYDVVVEVGVNVLNGILGAVHENQNTNFPTMPHSMNLFIDDRPRGPLDPVPESQRTGIQSRVEIQVSTPIVSLPVDTLEVRPELEGVGSTGFQLSAPPAAARFRVLDADLFTNAGIIVFPTRFGVPQIQAKVRIRAWVRDPTDDKLPEFLDGDLYVTTTLVRSEVAGVGTFLTLDRTNGPLVAFQPTPGTTVTEEQRQAVATIVGNVIRSDLDPSTFKVALPEGVFHFDFELEPEARRPSVMVMLTLTDRTPGPNARASVGAGLLPDGSDFAVAVGSDFVLGVVASLFSGLQSSYSYSKLGVSATVRPGPPTVDLQPGRIVFSIAGDGTISWFGVDDHFTFSIRQAFTLQVVDGSLEPVPDGDPVVSLDDVAVGGDYLEGKARTTIREERDAALAANADQIRETLNLGKQLEAILAGINPAPAGVTLTGVEIRPEGIVVPGRIGLAASGPAVVSEVFRAGFNDALASWIPGGTIDRMVWEQSSFPRGSNLVRVDEHRFVTEPMGITPFAILCLRVEGTRVTAGGGLVPVSSSACFNFSPVLTQVDFGSDPHPLLPLYGQVAGGGVRVVGHYDPWAPGRAPSGGHASLLVYFASDGTDEAAKVLGEAMGAARKRKTVVIPLAVVEGYGRAGLTGAGDHLVVEDPTGAWANAFGIRDAPAAVLVGPRGDVVWKETKAVTAKKVSAAVEKHTTRDGEVASIAIRLAVEPGSRPPDVPLRLTDGSELSLRRLRGRPLALTFYTTRSEPSLDHLEFLRDLAASRGSRAPLVIAVGDGETHDRAAELAKERQLPFAVLADPDRLISRRFGVWCWPATVWIRADQVIEAIDFGSAAPASTGRAPTGPRQDTY